MLAISICTVTGFLFGTFAIFTFKYFRQISEIPQFVVTHEGIIAVKIHENIFYYSDGETWTVPDNSFYRPIKKEDYDRVMLAKNFNQSERCDWTLLK